jgi:hypothetical protein
VVVVVVGVVVDLGGAVVVVEVGVTIDSFFVTLKPVGSVPLPDWLTTVTNLDPTAAPLAMTIFAVIWVSPLTVKPVISVPPPKDTAVAPVKLVPVITMAVIVAP